MTEKERKMKDKKDWKNIGEKERMKNSEREGKKKRKEM